MLMTVEFCIRCTHEFKHEEKYFLLGGYYCKPCIDHIQNDPSWSIHFRQLLALKDMIQIEA